LKKRTKKLLSLLVASGGFIRPVPYGPTAEGKLIASLMAALAEFERDLLRERVRSGIAAAKKRGVVFGRRPGQRVKADRFAPKVLKLVGEGQSYREISHRLGLAKTPCSIS